MKMRLFALSVLASLVSFAAFADSNVVQFDRSFDQGANSSRDYGYAGADNNAMAHGLVGAIADGRNLCESKNLVFFSVSFTNQPGCRITANDPGSKWDAVCHMKYKVSCIQP